MTRARAVFLMVAIAALAGCTNEASSCTAVANVNFVFYRNSCVSTWVRCDGEDVPGVASDRGGEFCDLENDFCIGPDRRETAIRRYTPSGRTCELCTNADGQQRCTPLPPGCGEHSVEHIASGSPDAGWDAGCGYDAGT